MSLWLSLHCVRLFKTNFMLPLCGPQLLSFFTYYQKKAKNIKWLRTTLNDVVQFPIFLLDFPADFLKLCL